MAKKLPTIWPLEPHTRAKHEILRRYLQAWIPILTRYHERVVFIDGFAGPGVYEGREPGSPIIALQAAVEHQQRIPGEMVFLFIENDHARATSLSGEVTKVTRPDRFRARVEPGSCAPVLTGMLDRVEASGRGLAPTFAFLDPFGFSHTPFELVARILRNPRCEVLLTFMYEEINRFLTYEPEAPHFDELFGTQRWRDIPRLVRPVDRQVALRELYRQQLLEGAHARYVHAFEMRNADNRVDYFLFFATNNVLGLRKMKEAMWKVDTTGGYSFSDATDPSQIVLFSAEPDGFDLERRLRAHFGDQEVRVEDIEDFVVAETPYRETHYKKQVLKRLEMTTPPLIEVLDAPGNRKRGQYPPGTVVRFVEQP
jgi:three-Cys-motif partner protein